MKKKVFVDGHEGTTGLKIHEYLNNRDDIDLLIIDSDKRKNLSERKKYINEADMIFLCLPDKAAVESVSLIENDNTKVIDASTAHRVNDGWVYGLPELKKDQRSLIRNSKRVSNPGCHATGFALSIYPMIENNIITKDYPITCTSITGYSGGGKSMIEKYESSETDFPGKKSPRHYGLTLNHKHLPEMKKTLGLINSPLFTPVVSNFYKGMAVSVPFHVNTLSKKVSAMDIHDIYKEYYKDEFFINVMPFENNEALESGFLNAEGCNDTNKVDIFVFGNESHILIVSRFDNLGKGASGAAIQNMNIMLGIDEKTGLKY